MDLPSTPQFGLNKRSVEASFPSHGSPHSSSSSLTHKHETLAPRVAKLGPQSRRSASTHDHPRALGKSLEVTFLNKVIQISLWSEAQSPSEQNERAGEALPEEENCEEITRVIDLAVTHFKIKLDFIESVHLVNVENSEIVWSDEDLSGDQAYYLCFARRGFKISQNTLANARHQDVALLDLEYFGRHGREFRVLVRPASCSGLDRLLRRQSAGHLHQPEQRQFLRVLLPLPPLCETVPQVLRPRAPLQYRGKPLFHLRLETSLTSVTTAELSSADLPHIEGM